jgi:hypothetical protein
MKNILAISLLYPILAISQVNLNLQKDSTIVNVCECTYVDLKETKFSPDLASLMTYKDFKKSGFDFKNEKDGFERLFIKNIDPSNLTIWTKRMVDLVYKKNIFSLNLTPCKTDKKYSEIYTQSKVFGDDKKDAFDVTIQLPSIQIELSEKIIRRWDTKTKKPLINNGLYLNSPILIQSARSKNIRLSLSEERGFSRFDNTTVCMNDTEISNTNVEIKLGGVFLFDLSYKNDYDKNYLSPGIKSYLDKLKVSNVDINNLSGIYSGASKINIPLEDYNIESNENNTIIINNNLVIGKIQIKCYRTENNQEILLPVNEKENKRFNINKLSETIFKLGFEKVKIEIDENNLIIYFMKYAERK